MGLGLKGLMGCALFTILLILLLKVALAKYPVKGVSDAIMAV